MENNGIETRRKEGGDMERRLGKREMRGSEPGDVE